RDPPADVEPLRTTLKEGVKSFRPRRYSPLQREFVRDYVRQLEELGYWACAAHLVAKQGEFRMTIDYRPINSTTIPITGTSRKVSSMTHKIAGAYGFCQFDMLKAFGRMRTAKQGWETTVFCLLRMLFKRQIIVQCMIEQFT
ncbi:TPA: hypothetical protein N0F65_001769, partial [Lagenidium giganteum]